MKSGIDNSRIEPKVLAAAMELVGAHNLESWNQFDISVANRAVQQAERMLKAADRVHKALPKWEYDVARILLSEDDTLRGLNQRGAAGWKVVARYGDHSLIIERPVLA